MAFTMSYGVTPRAEPVAKGRAKKGPPRVRKQTTPQAQAEALFEAAPAANEASVAGSEAVNAGEGVDGGVAPGSAPPGS